MATERVLTRNVGRPEALTVRGYREGGGYDALAKALHATMGLRVSPNAEEVGLDVTEHGERAYG